MAVSKNTNTTKTRKVQERVGEQPRQEEKETTKKHTNNNTRIRKHTHTYNNTLQFLAAGMSAVAIPTSVHCDHLITAKVEPLAAASTHSGGWDLAQYPTCHVSCDRLLWVCGLVCQWGRVVPKVCLFACELSCLRLWYVCPMWASFGALLFCLLCAFALTACCFPSSWAAVHILGLFDVVLI